MSEAVSVTVCVEHAGQHTVVTQVFTQAEAAKLAFEMKQWEAKMREAKERADTKQKELETELKAKEAELKAIRKDAKAGGKQSEARLAEVAV